MKILIQENKDLPLDELVELYRANGWSSADKPELLYKALQNSDSLISAWVNQKLVGIANAISDGHLVVYYPHLLVHPNYQKKGVGKKLVTEIQKKYSNFHQQMLTADSNSVKFYQNCGFEQAGETVPMWIYEGNEH